MGNASFDNVAVSLAIIHAMFKRVISSQLEEDAAHSDFKGYRVLDTSNRYFTPKDGNSDIENLPLGDEVNPHGFLVKAAGGAYMHTQDNKVCYYEKVVSKGGEPL